MADDPHLVITSLSSVMDGLKRSPHIPCVAANVKGISILLSLSSFPIVGVSANDYVQLYLFAHFSSYVYFRLVQLICLSY